MHSDTLRYSGFVLIFVGTLFVGLAGVFYYQYFQNLIAAGLSSSSSTTTTTTALSTYNGIANSPIFTTLSIFGLAFLVMGAVFVAGAHIGEILAAQALDEQHTQPEVFAPRPAMACTKCGTLLYENTPFCPNCGNPLGKTASPPHLAA